MRQGKENNSRGRRKKSRKGDAARKREYKEYELVRSLKRYKDFDSDKFWTADSESLEGLPQIFHVIGDSGLACCAVLINWLQVRASLKDMCEGLMRRSKVWQSATEDERSRATAEAERTATRALLHFLEFLPSRFDLSVARLCWEAIVADRHAISWERGDRMRWSLRKEVDAALKFEEQAIKNQLRIHEGPTPAFLHRSQYEKALKGAIEKIQAADQQVTLETVAQEFGEKREDAVDESTIRRWNKEFGVNWKEFKRQSRIRT